MAAMRLGLKDVSAAGPQLKRYPLGAIQKLCCFDYVSPKRRLGTGPPGTPTLASRSSSPVPWPLPTTAAICSSRSSSRSPAGRLPEVAAVAPGTSRPSWRRSRIWLYNRRPPRSSGSESLTLLSGVGWPTASVILHLCHREPHPILDFRALWSLSCSVRSRYDYPFYAAYAAFTRALCKRIGCDSRTLDRALWQYSKECQNGA